MGEDATSWPEVGRVAKNCTEASEHAPVFYSDAQGLRYFA